VPGVEFHWTLKSDGHHFKKRCAAIYTLYLHIARQIAFKVCVCLLCAQDKIGLFNVDDIAQFNWFNSFFLPDPSRTHLVPVHIILSN